VSCEVVGCVLDWFVVLSPQMVQAISPPVGEGQYIDMVHKLIRFNAPDPSGPEREWEGLLVQLVDASESADAGTKAGLLRVLHADGLVRMWESKEVSSVRAVHPEPFSSAEIDFKVDRSIFRGGTRQANQLKGKALVGKTVEVWNEMSRGWRVAKVTRDDGEVGVSYEDKPEEGELNMFDVWKLQGEDAEDGILREAEETIVESVHTKCVVTRIPEKKLVNIYKQLCRNEMPTIRTTKTMAWIEEDVGGGDRVSTVVHLPHHLDISKPVDAVMDAENWLLIAYTHLDEDVKMAD
jgi:hypothetical protein